MRARERRLGRGPTAPSARRFHQTRSRESYGLVYEPGRLRPAEREGILRWLRGIRPLWENRYADSAIPEGETQRRLLRPVYWLGGWQFACHHYYRPPRGAFHRCLAAEPIPECLQPITRAAEREARRRLRREDVPEGWRLNTCLVNFYGRRLEGDRWIDTARVGEHRDFEPGPVASLSLGERAMFQFVRTQGRGSPATVVKQQWLDDGSLQIFGGRRWKEELFHRVQRVDRRAGASFDVAVDSFEVRRVNFTFRYVPPEHIVRFRDLPAERRSEVLGYLQELARSSEFFAREIEGVVS